MRSRSILIAAVIALLPTAFMYRMLLLGRPLARDDASTMVYPLFEALDEATARGDLYLWDSARWCGLPAMATGQTFALYPPALALTALLPWQTALHVSYLLHLAAAFAAAMWFARMLGCSERGAMAGAAVWAFSGFVSAHLIHHNMLVGVAHIPLMLALVETALSRDERWPWALLALEVPVAITGSHPQLIVMAAVICALWLVLGHDWRREGEAPRRSVSMTLSVAAIMLLSLPQVLPTLELAAAQGRIGGSGDEAVEYIASYPFALRDVARVLLPNIYGTVHENVIGGGPAWHETQPFTGAAPLLLGLAGAIVAFRRRGWLFLVATLVIGAALMPAEGNPLHVLLARLPLWGSFRATGRWMLLPVFALSMFTAVAVSRLPHASERLRNATTKLTALLAAVIVVATALLWLTFAVTEDGSLVLPGQPDRAIDVEVPADAVFNCVTSWEPLLLVASTIIAAVIVGRLGGGEPASWGLTGALLLAIVAPQWHLWQMTNITAPTDYYVDRPETAAVAEDGWRVTTLPPAVAAPGWSLGVEEHDRRAMASRELLTPGLGTIWGLRYAEGYKQGIVTPATLRLWESFYHYGSQAFTGMAEISPESRKTYGTPAQRMKRLHTLAAVQHIITPGTIDDPELTLVHDEAVNVYRYSEYRPRTWLASNSLTIIDPAAQLQAIKARRFRPHHDVVVDKPVNLPPTDRDIPPGEVRIEEDRGTRIVLSAVCDRDCVLVLADAWDPGWRASVDGAPTTVMRADSAFRAIVLPAGKHEVVFSYWPRSWRWALPAAALGLMLVAWLAWPTSRSNEMEATR